MEEVLTHLDLREQGGNERHQVVLETRVPPTLEDAFAQAGEHDPHVTERVRLLG